MATYTNNCIEGKLNEDAVGFTAGERDSFSPYESPYLPDRIKKEWPKEMSAAEYEDLNNFFEYMITKRVLQRRKEIFQRRNERV
jgi:hypothetical protein